MKRLIRPAIAAGLLVCAGLASGVAAQPLPPTGEVRAFRDWSISCDNVRTCSALSVAPGEDGGWDSPVLVVTRDAGPAARARVEVLPSALGDAAVTGAAGAAGAAGVDGLRVVIAGQPAFALLPAGPDGARALSGAEVGRFLAAARPVQAAELVRGTGEPAATVSLSGLVAALRHMDAVQGRTGTVTALIDRGPVPAARVPAAAPLPRVTPVPFRPRPAGAVPRTVRRAITETCDQGSRPPEGERPVEAHDLGLGRTLWTVWCDAGAYNSTHMVVVTDARGTVTGLVPGLVPGLAGLQDRTAALWINLSIDPQRGLISQFAKGRGLGDCGQSDGMAWTGEAFVPVRSTLMDTCRGVMPERWPVLYRATLLAPARR